MNQKLTIIYYFSKNSIWNTSQINKSAKFIPNRIFENSFHSTETSRVKYNYQLMISDINSDPKELILEKSKNMSLKRLSSLFSIWETKVRAIIQEHKHKQLTQRNLEKRTKLPYRITEGHILKIKMYIDKNTDIRITLRLLLKHVNEDEDLPNLSMAGVKYIVKTALKYSYKKVHLLPKKMIRREQRREFQEAAYVQYWLDVSKCPLIFIDEFYLSSRSSASYNWSRRNTRSKLACNADPILLSFIISISNREIKGILGSNVSIKTNSFIIFLRRIWERVQEDQNEMKNFCIIMDNSNVHWNQETIKCINSNEIWCITITPYSPQLNAAKNISAVIL